MWGTGSGRAACGVRGPGGAERGPQHRRWSAASFVLASGLVRAGQRPRSCWSAAPRPLARPACPADVADSPADVRVCDRGVAHSDTPILTEPLTCGFSRNGRGTVTVGDSAVAQSDTPRRPRWSGTILADREADAGGQPAPTLVRHHPDTTPTAHAGPAPSRHHPDGPRWSGTIPTPPRRPTLVRHPRHQSRRAANPPHAAHGRPAAASHSSVNRLTRSPVSRTIPAETRSTIHPVASRLAVIFASRSRRRRSR